MACKEASGEIVVWRNRNLDKTYLWITGYVFMHGSRIFSREKEWVRGIFRYVRGGMVGVRAIKLVNLIYIDLRNLSFLRVGGGGLQFIYIAKTFKPCISYKQTWKIWNNIIFIKFRIVIITIIVDRDLGPNPRNTSVWWLIILQFSAD